MKKELEKILNVYWVAPHAPPDGSHFEKPRCGDCFCTIQKVHTHSGNEEYIKPILKLVKEYTGKKLKNLTPKRGVKSLEL